MVSKLLKGRGLWLPVNCKSFPTVYSRLRRFVDRGKMTYNYIYLCYSSEKQFSVAMPFCSCVSLSARTGSIIICTSVTVHLASQEGRG